MAPPKLIRKMCKRVAKKRGLPQLPEHAMVRVTEEVEAMMTTVISEASRQANARGPGHNKITDLDVDVALQLWHSGRLEVPAVPPRDQP